MAGGRRVLGLLGTSFRFHSDREGVLKDPKVEAYLRQNGGSFHLGVQNHSNSNSRAENFVTRLTDGVRCLLRQAGCPIGLWP